MKGLSNMKIDGLVQHQLQSVYNNKEVSDDTGFEAALKKAYDEGDKEKLKDACMQFESILLQSLFKQMKATIPKGGLFEESNARSIFEDMLDEELMNGCSIRGVGIADMMYKRLSAQMDRTFTASEDKSQTGEEESQSVIGAEEIDKPMD